MSVPGGTGPSDPEAIKAEIEQTRAQLGRTVDELSHRLDVPARAKEGAYRARDAAVATYRQNRPVVLGATLALALAGTVLGLIAWRKKRAQPRRKR